MTTSLTVVCPNKQRCAVKVTPGKPMNEVLDEACQRQGFDADLCSLHHQGRQLDLSLSVRLIGLPNNATLEMVKSAANSSTDQKAVIVSIALQVPDTDRHVEKFDPGCSLWAVLERFSAVLERRLTEADPKTGAVPSCGYMNKQWTGETELRAATLKAMGIKSGSALIRYHLKETSANELTAIEQRVADERQQRERMADVFAKKKAANEERERKEREIDEAYEREREQRARDEETARIAAAAISSSGNNNANAAANGDDNRAESLPIGAQRQQEQSQTGNSTNSTPVADGRLNRLQGLLSRVNDSLQSNDVDFLPDRLINDQGRIRLDGIEQVVNEQQMTMDLMDQVDFSNFKFPDEKPAVVASNSVGGAAVEEMDISSSSSNHHHDSTTPTRQTCDRQPGIFDVNHNQQLDNSESIAQDFFDVTIADVKKSAQLLALESKSQTERALLPRGFLETKNRQRKREAWPHTVIRVLLGEKRQLQLCFLSAESVTSLYKSVSESLNLDQGAKSGFKLCVPPNIEIKNDATQTLIDAELAPSATVVLKMARNKDGSLPPATAPVLNKSAADTICHQWLKANGQFVPYSSNAPSTGAPVRPSVTSSSQSSSLASTTGRRADSDASSTANFPKWFKKM